MDQLKGASSSYLREMFGHAARCTWLQPPLGCSPLLVTVPSWLGRCGPGRLGREASGLGFSTHSGEPLTSHGPSVDLSGSQWISAAARGAAIGLGQSHTSLLRTTPGRSWHRAARASICLLPSYHPVFLLTDTYT